MIDLLSWLIWSIYETASLWTCPSKTVRSVLCKDISNKYSIMRSRYSNMITPYYGVPNRRYIIREMNVCRYDYFIPRNFKLGPRLSVLANENGAGTFRRPVDSPLLMPNTVGLMVPVLRGSFGQLGDDTGGGQSSPFRWILYDPEMDNM